MTSIVLKIYFEILLINHECSLLTKVIYKVYQ